MLDYTALQQATIREQFVDRFKYNMISCSIARNIDEQLLDVNFSLRQAADEILPQKNPTKAKALDFDDHSRNDRGARQI